MANQRSKSHNNQSLSITQEETDTFSIRPVLVKFSSLQRVALCLGSDIMSEPNCVNTATEGVDLFTAEET